MRQRPHHALARQVEPRQPLRLGRRARRGLFAREALPLRLLAGLSLGDALLLRGLRPHRLLRGGARLTLLLGLFPHGGLREAFFFRHLGLRREPILFRLLARRDLGQALLLRHLRPRRLLRGLRLRGRFRDALLLRRLGLRGQPIPLGPFACRRLRDPLLFRSLRAGGLLRREPGETILFRLLARRGAGKPLLLAGLRLRGEPILLGLLLRRGFGEALLLRRARPRRLFRGELRGEALALGLRARGRLREAALLLGFRAGEFLRLHFRETILFRLVAGGGLGEAALVFGPLGRDTLLLRP